MQIFSPFSPSSTIVINREKLMRLSFSTLTKVFIVIGIFIHIAWLFAAITAVLAIDKAEYRRQDI